MASYDNLIKPHRIGCKSAYFCDTYIGGVLEEVKIMYAIIETGGKQYKVAPRDILRVEQF